MGDFLSFPFFLSLLFLVTFVATNEASRYARRNKRKAGTAAAMGRKGFQKVVREREINRVSECVYVCVRVCDVSDRPRVAGVAENDISIGMEEGENKSMDRQGKGRGGTCVNVAGDAGSAHGGWGLPIFGKEHRPRRPAGEKKEATDQRGQH